MLFRSVGYPSDIQQITEDDDDEIARLKRSRMALDMEEIEVYGSEKKTHFTIKVYGFDVSGFLHFLGLGYFPAF